jgi:hypothetical protein
LRTPPSPTKIRKPGGGKIITWRPSTDRKSADTQCDGHRLEAGKKADVMVIGRRGKPHLSPGLKPVSDVVFCANGSDVDTVVVGDGCGDERTPWTLGSLRSMIG